MVANGRIPLSDLVALPTSWSNKGEVEHLRRDAFESLTRMIARAVAETGVNFQITSGYRDYAGQVEQLKANYEPVNRGRLKTTDRTFEGRTWAMRPGRNVAASPGHSSHGYGISIDIVPAPIQTWLRANASRFGWVNDVPSEAWHWTYKNPGGDRYRSEGVLDHAWVQRGVGASEDGKIGTETVAAIRAFQQKHGLEVDGKVGPATRGVLAAGNAGEAVGDAVGENVPETATSAGFRYTYAREDWDDRPVGEKVHPFDHPVEGIYIHWPGTADALKDDSVEETIARLRGYRRDHVEGNGWKDVGYGAAVDHRGFTYELRGLGMEPGSNGGAVSNEGASSILCLMGTRERPTPEMIEGVNGLLKQYGTQFEPAPADEDGKQRVLFLAGHKDSPDASTSCPGARLMDLLADGTISYGGDGVVRPGPAPRPEPSRPAPAQPKKLAADGKLGPATASELQRRLGVAVDGKLGPVSIKAGQTYVRSPHVDGKIDRQNRDHRDHLAAIRDDCITWEKAPSKGSPFVSRLQAYIGAEVDGRMGPAFVKRLQEQLNANPDLFRAADRDRAAKRIKAAGL